MRKQKTIKIDDREITVRELKVKHIRAMLDQSASLGPNAQFADFLLHARELLPVATTLTADEMSELAPSELQMVWEAFREVNAVFFDLLTRAGVGEALEKMIRKILEESLSDPFAPSFPAGIPTPGSTAGAGS